VIALAVGLSGEGSSGSGSSKEGQDDPAASLPLPGALVLANWTKDSYWYPATVLETDGGRARVQYADGQNEWIGKDRIAALAFRVGDRVQTISASATYVWATVVQVEDGRLLLRDALGNQEWRPVALVRMMR
jgi:hypothetical protein